MSSEGNLGVDFSKLTPFSVGEEREEGELKQAMEAAQVEAPVKKRIANVVLLGCGGVGRALLQRIIATRDLHASTGLHVTVVAVADSEGVVSGNVQLHDSALKDIITAKAENVPLSKWHSSGVHDHCEFNPIAGNEEFLEFLLTWSFPTVLVDCTASGETGKLLALAAAQGFCVVLANKKPITSTLDIYDKIVAGGRQFRCEATVRQSQKLCQISVASGLTVVPSGSRYLQGYTYPCISWYNDSKGMSQVGAGLPVMATLSRTLAAGDPIHKIVGALSGTLGYVMSGLQDGWPYSEVVTTAKALGYTEPDPRDDLSGMDVARKALIIARTLGWRLNLTNVEVEPLFNEEMRPQTMPLEEFLEKGLPSLDTFMREKVYAARDKNCVLRYVARIENDRCKVGLMEVSPDCPLGRLRGSDNLVEIFSDCYEASPLVIQGAGAGNDTTAAGVLADIIDLQDLYI